MKTDKSKYKKPTRPCPFCQKPQAHLSRHILTQHKHEEKVKELMSVSVSERTKQIDLLKKEGIYLANSKETGDYIRERNQSQEELTVCDHCKGFFSKSLIWKHLRNCNPAQGEHLTTTMKQSMVRSNPSDILSYVPVLEFQTEICGRFRSDEVGQLCKTDTLIVLYGENEWKKGNKQECSDEQYEGLRQCRTENERTEPRGRCIR